VAGGNDPRQMVVHRSGGRGSGGVWRSGHWAGGRKCRMGWSRVGDAREQENRGSKGVLGTHAMAAASCQPGGVRVGVAHAGKGQQGRAGATVGVQVTRGGGWKQEVVLAVLQRAAQRRQGEVLRRLQRGAEE
jgi:hypothetical protein